MIGHALDTADTVYCIGIDPGLRMRLGPLVVAAGWNFRTHADADQFLARYQAGPGASCILLEAGAGAELPIQRRLADARIHAPVVVTGRAPALTEVVEAYRLGARDYLDGSYSDARLLEVVRGALAWDRRHRAQREARAEVAARATQLTEREREVMRRVIDGATCKQIALERGVSSQAIDAHRKRVLRKMQARNVPELVRLAVAGGLINPTTGDPAARL